MIYMEWKIKHFLNLSGKHKPTVWLEFDTLFNCSSLNYRGTEMSLKAYAYISKTKPNFC